MIQAIGLTSAAFPRGPRQQLRRAAPEHPAVHDLTFEARAGAVTALVGEPGSGKTAALRLMLQLDPSRGVTLFRGRPLNRLAVPAREIGVLLGDVPGHPARSARNHLRMLAAALGVPVERADRVLARVGLDALADDPLDTLSLSMDRRLGLAVALLGEPPTLIVDDPARDLARREAAWFHGMLRELADSGVCVLTTTTDARLAARFADRILRFEEGRIRSDEDAREYARTLRRPGVSVKSPQAARLADLLQRTGSTHESRLEVVREEGNSLTVYGAGCAAVGELAHRGGILIHELADLKEEKEEAALPPSAPSGDERPVAPTVPPLGGPPRPVTARRPRGPVQPLRYELRRATTGSRIPSLTAALTLAASVVGAVYLAHAGGGSGSEVPALRLLTGWPPALPLPAAAIGAGFLGAHAFGQEFAHPALAPVLGTVPRRLGLLCAKLLSATSAALLLMLAVILIDATALLVLYGDILHMPDNGGAQILGWAGLTAGCAWIGVLAAGVLRSTALGMAAVLTIPVAITPLVHSLAATGAAHRLAALPGRLNHVLPFPSPFGPLVRLGAEAGPLAQPFGQALLLSLVALLAAYARTSVRSRSG